MVIGHPSLPRPTRRLARFSTVSLLSTAVTLVAIALLEDVARFSSAEAALLATACGFACSYPMNRRWTFDASQRVGHALAVAWLGGLSVVGLLLCGVAGAGVDLLAAHANLSTTTTLASEETAESLVLGALFFVRFAVSRALFAEPRRR